MTGKHRWLIFWITFISYASTHACRQSFASAKNLMQTNWGFSEDFEGLMDGIFLMAYSLGLFSSGVMGDKFDTARFHAFGLYMTSFIYFITCLAARPGALLLSTSRSPTRRLSTFIFSQ